MSEGQAASQANLVPIPDTSAEVFDGIATFTSFEGENVIAITTVDRSIARTTHRSFSRSGC